jgi:PAS domain S-box-containing protein
LSAIEEKLLDFYFRPMRVDTEEPEAAITVGEEQFRALFENSAVGMCQSHPDTGKLLRVNRRFCEMTGYSKAELVGRAFFEITHPEHRDRHVQDFLRVGRGEIPEYRVEKPFRQKGGSVLWAEVTANLVRDPQGRRVHTLLIVQDITKRRVAEDALQLAGQSLSLAQRAAQAGVWDWDIANDKLYLSPEYRDLYGLPADAPVTYDMWLNFIYDEDRERIASYGKTFFESGTDYRVEFRIKHPTRGVRWLAGIGTLTRDANGRGGRFTGINLDITDRKQAEEALNRLVDALREADRRKNDFIATLAHELRNPLAPIRSSVELFRFCTPGDRDWEWGRELIEQQVSHMVRLLDDLLDISRIARNKLQLKKEKIELARILETALQSTRSLLEERRHQVTVTMATEAVQLNADAVRLTQTFVNLINNAAKYTPPGGRIEITVEHDGETAVVRVKDNGVGIAPEKLPLIFGMFYQADRSYEQVQGGLGIGLTLVKQLVEMHGGTIEARSSGLMEGSEFILRLPAQIKQPGSLSAKATEYTSVMPRRILIVDDYPNAAESLARWLRRMGNEVEIALDGLQAVEAAERLRPEIVLLDIGLPKLNGYEVAKKIRSQSWGREMVLVALTGWGQEEDRHRTSVAGFDVHLVKPVDHVQLATVLGASEAR